jgi:hypothetical protein
MNIWLQFGENRVYITLETAIYLFYVFTFFSIYIGCDTFFWHSLECLLWHAKLKWCHEIFAQLVFLKNLC